MKRLLAALLCLLAAPAWAQAILQTGTIKQYDLGGFAADRTLQASSDLLSKQLRGFNPFYVTDKKAAAFCADSDIRSGAYSELCFGHDSTGNAQITLNSLGGEPNRTFTININGSIYPFPGPGTGNMLGPVSSVTNDLVGFADAGGALTKDSGINSANVLQGPSVSGSVYFGGGRPWGDVQATMFAGGAKADGVTDDAPAIQAAINAVQALGGGMVFFPPPHGGAYCVKTSLTTPGSGAVNLRGTSLSGAVLSSCNTDTNLLNLTAAYSLVENIQFLGRGSSATDTFAFTQPTLIIGAGCVDCRLNHVITLGGTNAIRVVNTGDVILEDIFAAQSYSNAVVYLGGQAWLRRAKIDQAWPVTGVCCGNVSFAARTNSTFYGAGSIVNFNGYNWQASVSGTSGTSAPASVPYSSTAADTVGNPGGALRWKLVGNNTAYVGLQVDTGSSQVIGEQVDLNGTFSTGMLVSNSLAGAAPFLTSLSHTAFGNLVGDAIKMQAGWGLSLDDVTVGGCALTGCAGVNFATGFLTSASMVNSKFYNGSYGVLINAGSNIVISGGNIFAGENTACLSINNTVNHVNTVGNNFVNDSNMGGACAIGYQTGATASDYLNFSQNITHGSTTPLQNLSTGTHNQTLNNL